MQDFGPGWEASGLVRFRGETAGEQYATDGQAGVVLRCYREHQMSPDDAFLKRNWPKIKKAMEYLMGHDADHDGVLKDAQPNTLDTAYYGPNSAMSSLYLAALRAAEEMAREIGDEAFAKRVRPIFDSGSAKVTAEPVERRVFLPQTRSETSRSVEGRRRLFRRSGVRPKLGVPDRPRPHPAGRDGRARH